MRVVILGAGYAGLTVARRLERTLPSSVELVLVDESDTHLLQHELHRVIRRPAIEDTITVPLADVVSRADIRQARVTALDPETQVVTLETPALDSAEKTEGGHETLSYDAAAVCLGSETDFSGLESVAEHATPLKRLDHAHEIRQQALTADGGGAVVGGAGLSGIQAAGELAALSAEDGLGLDVTLVELADRIAPAFDETFGAALRRELESRDVSVETGVAVDSATEESVTLADGRTLPADVFVWTGGIRGPAALGGERLAADADLRVGDSTFVVGDAGTITDQTGTEAPASAQTAVRQARIGARNIRRYVESADDGTQNDRQSGDLSEENGSDADPEENGSDADPEEDVGDTDSEEGVGDTAPAFATYQFDTPGWVVTVGDEAVAHVGPVVLSGEPAKATKAVIGAGHLGSVGAIGRASELVAEELGWPTSASLGVSGPLNLRQLTGLPTDPASPGEVQYPLANLAFSLVEPFSPEDPVDLTDLTRQTDRNNADSVLTPDGAFDAMQRTFSRTMDLAVTLGSHDTDTESER